MAITVDINTDKKISLDEFTDYVKKNVDSRDEDSLLDSALMLKSLANNKSFFTDKLNSELENWDDFQRVNLYTSQTFTFWSEDDLSVRANLWVPPAENPQQQTWTNQMFYYNVPHDHNFSFITIGFWGKGYETTIYEYEHNDVVGNIGEKVDLKFLETTKLNEGKIMLYRAHKDIHSQAHPEEFSISLNLLSASPEQGFKDQFCFDLDTGKISSHVETTNTTRIMLCKLAKYVGNARSVSLLEAIAENHPAAKIRVEAFSSLTALEPDETERIWNTALSDKNSYVREWAKSEIVAVK